MLDAQSHLATGTRRWVRGRRRRVPRRRHPPHADAPGAPAVLTAVLTASVLAFVGFRLASTASLMARSAVLRGQSVEIVRGIRWRHLWPVPFVLAAVYRRRRPPRGPAACASAGGRRSAVSATPSPAPPTRRRARRWSGSCPSCSSCCSCPALPLFAFREEEIFRARGRELERPAPRAEGGAVRPGARPHRHPHRRGPRPRRRRRLLPMGLSPRLPGERRRSRARRCSRAPGPTPPTTA